MASDAPMTAEELPTKFRVVCSACSVATPTLAMAVEPDDRDRDVLNNRGGTFMRTDEVERYISALTAELAAARERAVSVKLLDEMIERIEFARSFVKVYKGHESMWTNRANEVLEEAYAARAALTQNGGTDAK